MVTTANEPVVPETVAGLRAIDSGWFCGAMLSCEFTLLPFHVAVILASVLVETAFVGIGTDTVELPAWTVATAGTIAAGESPARFTDAPPEGACPFNVIIATAVAPPL